MSESLDDFFAAYGSAFDDPEAMRRFYGDASIASTPEGVYCLNSANDVAEALKSVSRYQLETGMRSLEPAAVKGEKLDDLHEWVKVAWKARFDKLGDKDICFDISYLLRRYDDSFHIVAYVSHQSETKMREKLGVS